MYKYKIAVRPNNQVTLTRLDMIEASQPRYENFSTPKLSQNERNILVERLASKEGLKTVRKSYDPLVRIVSPQSARPLDKNSPVYLDLIKRFQRGDGGAGVAIAKKRGWGVSPRIRYFGAAAGQALRESGAIVDMLCGGDSTKCRVITLTLPASGHLAYKALSDYSGEITNRILQTVRRKKDDGFYYFYVLEHQKRGALHWHICLYHEDKTLSEQLGQEIVSKWRSILGDIGGKAGVDLLFSKGFGRRVESNEMQSLNQQMYSGCAGYFAKYAGKTSGNNSGGGDLNINSINAQKYPVSSFWGRSRNLVRECRRMSLDYCFVGLAEETADLFETALDVLMQYECVNSMIEKVEVYSKPSERGRSLIAEGARVVYYCRSSDFIGLLSELRIRYDGAPTSAILERAKKRGNGIFSAFSTLTNGDLVDDDEF